MVEGEPGRRRPGRPRAEVLVAVAAVVAGLSGCAGGAGDASGRPDGALEAARPAPGNGGPAVRWDGALRLPGPPERLTLYFAGGPPGPPDDPCARAYRATVASGADRVTVILRELPSPAPPAGHGCADVGYERSLMVELPDPLRGRPVVDGATGEERAVVDAARLLWPSWLPPGYRFETERVEAGVDLRTWAPVGRHQVRLLVDQGAAEELSRPGHDPVVLARPVVRGRPATVWKDRGFDDLVCVSWAEGDGGHRVCSSGAPGRLLPVEDLVRVAERLQVMPGGPPAPGTGTTSP